VNEPEYPCPAVKAGYARWASQALNWSSQTIAFALLVSHPTIRDILKGERLGWQQPVPIPLPMRLRIWIHVPLTRPWNSRRRKGSGPPGQQHD